MTLSGLIATPTPTNNAIPISNGSGAAGESLDGWVSSGSGGPIGPIAAEDVTYSNGSSGLAATNVQDAIDELAASSGSGSIDLQAALDALSTTRGAIIFRGATQWEALEPGVPGYFLMTNGSGGDPSWQLLTNPNYIYGQWIAAVNAVGGTYESDSKDIALAFSDQLVAFSGFTKILWLLPFLGGNLAAARVPLIDTLGVGQAGNTAFVDADFTQATGLQGNGTTKQLNSLVPPGSSGSQQAGLGWWETNSSIVGTDSAIFAVQTASPDYRWLLDFRTGNEVFAWGPAAGGVGSGAAPGNGHYYAQSNGAADRKLYKDAAQIGSNTSNQPASLENSLTLRLFGNFISGVEYFHDGRCGCAYFTDGTLTPTEISDLHTLINDFLITPTGR